jgi:Na+/H+ antiporter NhaA
VRPEWLALVFGAMGMAYALRKWHFRKELVTHQPWQPYIFVAGVVAWIGLIQARLHPAVSLAFVVPFMPGPDRKQLDHLDEEIEEELEDDMSHGKVQETLRKRKKNIDEGTLGEDHRVNETDIIAYHHAHHGRGTSIQAGLFGGLLGHRVDDAFKVKEYDEDGDPHMNVSTLDSFEHFFKVYADLGLGLFTLTNAGVPLRAGSMTSLVFLSLVVGNYCGILATYKLAKWLGFLPPLGIRTRHMRMIGLIASMGLTVALFVSDVAFTDARLVADAKIGSLLSSVVGVVAWGISQYYDLSHELVDEQAKLQVSERAHAPTDNPY